MTWHASRDRVDSVLHIHTALLKQVPDLPEFVLCLCDREAEMLNRGRSPDTLAGLRKRLQSLFLQFIETPDFNPEATRFLKVPPKLSEQKQLMSLTA